MLLIGQQRQRTCGGLTRRAFLQVGGSTVLGLSFADLLRLRAQGAPSAGGSAKSVLLLWLWGGPAHLDTWDPKPDAAIEYRGPFSPIATKVPSIRVAELFPQIAEQAGHFCILRSLHTASNDHGVAGTIGLTGSGAGALDLGGKAAAGGVRAATGSVVARVRGFQSKLPPFLVIGGRLYQGKKVIAGEGGGALGIACREHHLGHGAPGGPVGELAHWLLPSPLIGLKQADGYGMPFTLNVLWYCVVWLNPVWLLLFLVSDW